MFEKRHFERVAGVLGKRLANTYELIEEGRHFDLNLEELSGYCDGVFDSIADLMRLFDEENDRFNRALFARAVTDRLRMIDPETADRVKDNLIELGDR